MRRHARFAIPAFAAFCLCSCLGPPGGKITSDSETEECSAELGAALEAFKRDNGFDYETSLADGKTLMSEGVIAKQYARDGVRVRLDFGLKPGDDGCSLVAYRMTRNEPGKSVTTGSQGSVALEQCSCVAGD
jgi:hypothetical protein